VQLLDGYCGLRTSTMSLIDTIHRLSILGVVGDDDDDEDDDGDDDDVCCRPAWSC
jgi:hypothetical protein